MQGTDDHPPDLSRCARPAVVVEHLDVHGLGLHVKPFGLRTLQGDVADLLGAVDIGDLDPPGVAAHSADVGSGHLAVGGDAAEAW